MSPDPAETLRVILRSCMVILSAAKDLTLPGPTMMRSFVALLLRMTSVEGACVASLLRRTPAQ